jgi:aspartate aminotransferase
MSTVSLAARLLNASPSATLGAADKADKLRQAGRDIISMAAGEPDFDTPLHVKEAAIKATMEGKTRYTAPAGLPQLRDAIAQKLRRDNGLEYTRDSISVGCGAKQSLFNVFMATLNPGDEVIVPAPYWVSYVDIPVLVGASVKVVQCPAETGYRLDAQRLEAAIGPSSKWLVLCSPSNPSGAAYSDCELESLAEVLRRHPHVGVIMDHIYEHLVYDGVVAKTINRVAPDLADRTVVINGMSKGYCMTGWRVGYAAGPKHVIEAVTSIQSQSTTSTSTVSQWAAIAALEGDQGFIQANNLVFRKRRDLVVSALNAIPGLNCPKPEGAFYVYPSCAELIGRTTPNGSTVATDQDFAAHLLDHGVMVVHGAAFGLSPHFRISYAASEATLAQACQRIASACAELG